MKLSTAVLCVLLLAPFFSLTDGAPKKKHALCSNDYEDSTVQTTISWVPTAAVANDNGGQVNDHVDGGEGDEGEVQDNDAVVELYGNSDDDDDVQLVEDSDDDFAPLALNLSRSDGNALIDSPVDSPVSHPREGTGTPTASPPRELSHRDPSSAVRGVLDERRSSNIRDDFHQESSDGSGSSSSDDIDDSTGTCRANDASPPTNDGGAIPGNLLPPSSDGGIAASYGDLVHLGGSESTAMAKAVETVPGPRRRSGRLFALPDVVSYKDPPINCKMRDCGGEYGEITTHAPPASQEAILPAPTSIDVDNTGDIHATRRRFLRAAQLEHVESTEAAAPSAQSPTSAQSPPVSATDGEDLHLEYDDEAIAGCARRWNRVRWDGQLWRFCHRQLHLQQCRRPKTSCDACRRRRCRRRERRHMMKICRLYMKATPSDLLQRLETEGETFYACTRHCFDQEARVASGEGRPTRT